MISHNVCVPCRVVPCIFCLDGWVSVSLFLSLPSSCSRYRKIFRNETIAIVRRRFEGLEIFITRNGHKIMVETSENDQKKKNSPTLIRSCKFAGSTLAVHSDTKFEWQQFWSASATVRRSWLLLVFQAIMGSMMQQHILFLFLFL